MRDDYWSRALLPNPPAKVELLRHYSMGMPSEPPQPAEACTDLGTDDDTPAGSARGLLLTLIALAVALASAAIRFWPQIVAALEEIL